MAQIQPATYYGYVWDHCASGNFRRVLLALNGERLEPLADLSWHELPEPVRARVSKTVLSQLIDRQAIDRTEGGRV